MPVRSNLFATARSQMSLFSDFNHQLCISPLSSRSRSRRRAKEPAPLLYSVSFSNEEHFFLPFVLLVSSLLGKFLAEEWVFNYIENISKLLQKIWGLPQ